MATHLQTWANPFASLQPDDPTVEDLRFLALGLQTMEAALSDAIVAARDAGIAWQPIADALGITRQSAWQRYRHAKFSV